MDHSFCPGSKLLRQPAPEMFPCPGCGEEVEIWTDEVKGTCLHCGRAVLRDAGAMSCLDWCKYGKDCVGEVIYEKYMQSKAVGIKQKLMDAVEEHFGEDRRRIDHALGVLRYAERLMEAEEGDWHIVLPAALLHDVGIKPAEARYGSAEARYQEQEGPPIARKILLALGMRMEDIDEVCAIIAHHHSPQAMDTANFNIVYDADCLVNLEEQLAGLAEEERRRRIQEVFRTRRARAIAAELHQPSGAPRR